MLPSTGLFKDFACPYYDSADGTCMRPYCHFKHVRKDEVEVQPAKPTVVPEYKPAPKLLPLPPLSMLTMPTVKKKAKLEYQPEKPALNASPSKHKEKVEESQAPVYIPASASSIANGEHKEPLLDLDDCEEELDELSGIIDDQMLEDAVAEAVLPIKVETDEPDETKNKESKQSKVVKSVRERKPVASSSIDNAKSVERRDSTASSTSSSKHKHKSSSRSKESIERKSNRDVEKKRDKDREKDREKHRDRHREKDKDRTKTRDKDKHEELTREKRISSKSSSSTSSKHKAATSSTSTSLENKKDKHHSSSSSSTKHKSSPSSSSSSLTVASKHKSSSSSRSSSTAAASKPKSSASSSTSAKSTSKPLKSNSHPAPGAATAESFEFDAETAELFATTEDDIMKECEMIYDQMELEFAAIHQDAAKQGEEHASKELKRKISLDEDDAAAVALQKKRVAYENADKYKSLQPLALRKPNHIRNAMQAIFHRQSVLRRKQEEDKTAASTALRDAEEKVREANEELRKIKEKNSLTPLIPKTYLTPPVKILSRSIAPVANMLALERAKKKVQELKAEKMPAFTPAQSRKGATRTAHKATAALAVVEPEKQPKPPVLEANSTKISFNIRMQYYEMMVKHCMVMYPTAADAWERAQTEELAVFKKCNTPVIYKSSCLLAINKLRKEAAESGNKPVAGNKLISHEVILAGKLAQNTSWSVQKKMKTVASVGGEPFDKLPGDKAYDMVYDLHLTEEQLIANGYPRAGKRAGTAIISNLKPMRRPNETERYCSRCGKVFNLAMYDEVCADECNYHPKSTGYRRGYADNQHRCCQQPAGTPGCTYANYHVTDYIDANNLTGYVSTIDKDPEYVSTKKDIYALDCEMCYTTEGIELTRVTVVDINGRTVYDALVKPDNKIVDYNTVYSGITEQLLANETRTLRDVQAILMSMFHSKTVLLGHSLESDLKALRLIHSVVVDTSVLFPHKMGPPKKRALKTLCIENLKRIIQENEGGHDSAEDAEVCIQLVKFYLRNKIS